MTDTPLKRARQAKAWSQTRLILEMRAEAAKSGLALPEPASLKTQVSRWENGHRAPDALYQRLLAQVYGQPAATLGLVSAADGSMADVGIAYADTWTEGIDHVTALWAVDVDRRNVLRGLLFSAAASSGPVLRWLVSDDDEPVNRDCGSRPVRHVDIATIREMTSVYRGLDNQHGGGGVRVSPDLACRWC